MKLTKQQVEQFDQQGFIHLPAAIPTQLLETIKQLADSAIAEGFAALKQNKAVKDFAFNYQFLRPYLNRLSHYHRHAGFDSLISLGCPEVLDIATSLCGWPFIPTVDMLILKNKYDNLNLPWHQDLIFDTSQYRVIAVGIYLEAAVAGDGALKFINHSQHQRHDIDALMADPTVEVTEVTAQPGDIVVHNPMLVHWSDMLKQQTLRRTLYYEFRPIAQVEQQESWPIKIIEQRLKLMHSAIALYADKYPQAPQFIKDSNEQWPNGTEITHDLDALYQDRIPYVNANFCRALNEQLKQQMTNPEKN